MLSKKPKPVFWKFIRGSAKVLFVAEAACFAGSYYVYYRMNTNREFRHYMNENFPSALNYFYKAGELLGGSNLRQLDSAVWSADQKKEE